MLPRPLAKTGSPRNESRRGGKAVQNLNKSSRETPGTPTPPSQHLTLNSHPSNPSSNGPQQKTDGSPDARANAIHRRLARGAQTHGEDAGEEREQAGPASVVDKGR